MTSGEIREKFLKFFQERGHTVLPSSSLVPQDPSLLVTGAGMIQFKPIFQGEVKPEFTGAATCQKCARTTDIERVGRTARHLTFFEMLGNFSFGDYYKKEAISWAWEFLTGVLKFDPDKLWVTIYREDDESFGIWKIIGFPEERIVRMGEEDNFWSAGPTGPCGPCSELVYDFGEERGCGKETCSVDCDCDRFLEVWNLVFMQYNRDEKGNLNLLPKKNIDTGMGLERAAAVLQGVFTTFETDLLKPIVDRVADLAGVEYGKNAAKDVSLRIIADHVRAVTFLIGDGVLPSNEGRGYILRRLLRRAVRHGRLLGIKELFLSELIDVVVKVMEEVYPEVRENREFITRIATSEEERFSQTLRSGLSILGEVVKKVKSRGALEVPGDAVFQLYDTYGFPVELTEEIAEESGLSIDRQGFDVLMEEQRAKARATWEEKKLAGPKEVYNEILDQYGETEFVGYSQDVVRATVVAIVKGEVVVPKAQAGEEIEIVLDKTPFYAEMGGQVGDTGLVETTTGKFEATDAQISLPGVYIHRGKVVEGTIEAGQVTTAAIDTVRRAAICRNHTATHLLQWALRTVLGKHARQAGSLVSDRRFRFDFTHPSALTSEEIRRVEKLVNGKIFENHPVRCYVTSLEFAKESGAIALFGEKYDEFVRVVEVDEISRELCGGTHVTSTAEVGLLKIIDEGSIGANLRRIEALTSHRALDYIYREEKILEKVADSLKIGVSDVAGRIESLLADLKDKECEIESLRSRLMGAQVEEIVASARIVNGVKVILKSVEARNVADLRSYVDLLREKVGSGIIVLAAVSGRKAMLVSAVTSDLVGDGFHAGEILKEIAPLVGGGGGGKPELAQAGGKHPEKIPQALEKALGFVRERVKKRREKTR
ncbi:MAG TPA: alanine--tRNA ligase [Actinobacteria bacterium]|nr:alanine--tRNA ligase [Actinomycetota bacterium]